MPYGKFPGKLKFVQALWQQICNKERSLSLTPFVIRNLQRYLVGVGTAYMSWCSRLPCYMSFVFVCWHSRKWWPPIRLGTLQLAVLRLKKVNWTDFFVAKTAFSIQIVSAKANKKTGRKTGKKNPIKGGFPSPSDQLAEFEQICSKRFYQ